MKRTLLVVLSSLIAVSAHATIIMYAQNQNGGTIQFSDMACSKLRVPSLSKMDGYASVIIDSTGEPLSFGCYTYAEPNLAVTWQDGTVRWYDVGGVTITADGKRLFEAAKKASY